jgi:hypothetical protein
MPADDQKQSTAESLRKTRTYGKFRCHNPSCMGRLHWIRPDFPRIRGPVWEVNKKLAEEAWKKLEEK